MFNIKNYDDDLYFTCSTLEFISRYTKNKRADVVNKIGFNGLYKLYDLACVNHCLSPEQLIDECIDKFKIEEGNFDNTSNCKVECPTEYGIGSLYMSLILNTLDVEVQEPGEPRTNIEYKTKVIENLVKIYNSWICKYVDNYNNMVFTENTDYLYTSYINGKLEDH